ncbi:hypothetical protein TSOC_006078 [Tetrabaena socialis]|uniref:Uncharacterized protein n=1 Tax=Tetrabaena socialis TaxID=47790 RepID=A0A2J8A4K2_9CHLO|nr:hypothetical protein TSOC_006078 [Tetrabaena socialis]|eukprot:PNH07444.1 hypothetical protein TSOC_006078 [Tetrabaena socialis]
MRDARDRTYVARNLSRIFHPPPLTNSGRGSAPPPPGYCTGKSGRPGPAQRRRPPAATIDKCAGLMTRRTAAETRFKNLRVRAPNGVPGCSGTLQEAASSFGCPLHSLM